MLFREIDTLCHKYNVTISCTNLCHHKFRVTIDCPCRYRCPSKKFVYETFAPETTEDEGVIRGWIEETLELNCKVVNKRREMPNW